MLPLRCPAQVGGETVFYGPRGREVARVAPRAGMALLHRHGEAHCLEHEGAAVEAGLKYVLRSDVVFGRAERGSGVVAAGAGV